MNRTLLTYSFAAALAASAFGQVSNFDTLNGYASGVEVRLARSRLDALREGRAEASGLVVSGHYINRKVDAALDSIERSAHGESGRVGYSWRFDAWNVGAGIGYGTVRTDYHEVNSPAPIPLQGYVSAKFTEGAAWVSYQAEGWRVAATGSVGQTSNKGRRVSDAGSSAADYDSSENAFAVSLSREFPVGESLLVEPFAAVSWASSSVDGFAEQGTAPDRRVLRDFSMDENRGGLGVRLAGKSGTWVPSLSVGWLARFSGGDTAISNTASNGSNLGVGVIPAAADGLFYIGTGVSGRFAEKWVASANLDYLAGGDERALGITLTVGRQF